MEPKDANNNKYYNLRKNLEEYRPTFNRSRRCNILVIGRTGVGKSTLINTVFGKDLTATGLGKRITTEIQKYTKEGSPITFYDTPGLQLFSGEEIEYIKFLVSDLIDEAHIHVVWYCIDSGGSRIDPIEKDWIREIDRQKIPIILLLTKSYISGESEFIQYIKSQELPIKDAIPIVTQPIKITADYTVDVQGLENLVKVTASVLPEAPRKAFLEGQKLVENASEYSTEHSKQAEAPMPLPLRLLISACAGALSVGLASLGIEKIMKGDEYPVNKQLKDSEDNEDNAP